LFAASFVDYSFSIFILILSFLFANCLYSARILGSISDRLMKIKNNHINCLRRKMIYLFILLLQNVFLLQFRLDDILNNLGKVLDNIDYLLHRFGPFDIFMTF